MENEIIRLLRETGPLTGSEIMEATGGDGLMVWRTCMLSKNLDFRTVGTRYLRLDRNVKGFARLSPSILREFLTFSVVGLQGEAEVLVRRTQELISHIERVSRAKLDLVYRIASGLVAWLKSEFVLENEICFIIGGDIVYNMAHDVPRPERSTGKMVTGSDMDLVVIVDDAFPDELMEKLDDSIYEEKSRLLMAPHLKEEIDYIIKKLARVREQVQFDTFKKMVACKILHEGTLLYGSENLFATVKALLREHGVTSKLNDLEQQARVFRQYSEEYLLHETPKKIKEESLSLFYPTEESKEFE